MKTFTKDFFIAAFKRALHAFAQTALSFITIGLALNEVDWKKMLSVAAVAMIYSLIKSLAVGMPEMEEDGTLMIDDSGDTTKWLLAVDTPLDKVNQAKSIRLKVQPDADLKQDEPKE